MKFLSSALVPIYLTNRPLTPDNPIPEVAQHYGSLQVIALYAYWWSQSIGTIVAITAAQWWHIIIHYQCNGQYKRQRHTTETKTNVCIMYVLDLHFFLPWCLSVCFWNQAWQELNTNITFLLLLCLQWCYMKISSTYHIICLYLPKTI